MESGYNMTILIVTLILAVISFAEFQLGRLYEFRKQEQVSVTERIADHV